MLAAIKYGNCRCTIHRFPTIATNCLIWNMNESLSRNYIDKQFLLHSQHGRKLKVKTENVHFVGLPSFFSCSGYKMTYLKYTIKSVQIKLFETLFYFTVISRNGCQLKIQAWEITLSERGFTLTHLSTSDTDPHKNKWKLLLSHASLRVYHVSNLKLAQFNEYFMNFVSNVIMNRKHSACC